MYRYILLFLPLLFGGCVSDPETFRSPDLFQPGHINDQKGWVTQFDPFACSEMGPKIVGDRPSGALDPTPVIQRRFSCPEHCGIDTPHVHR